MNEMMTAFMVAELRRLELQTLAVAGTRGQQCRWRHELSRQPRVRARRVRVRGWVGRRLIGVGERLCASPDTGRARRLPAEPHDR